MKPSVLVVDDDRVTRELIANLLKHTYQDQISLFKARDRASAKAFCDKHTIDILITDVFMPDGNGLELVNEVTRDDDSMVTVVFSGNKDVVEHNHEINCASYTPPTHLITKEKLVDNVLWIMEESMEKFPLDDE